MAKNYSADAERKAKSAKRLYFLTYAVVLIVLRVLSQIFLLKQNLLFLITYFLTNTKTFISC